MAIVWGNVIHGAAVVDTRNSRIDKIKSKAAFCVAQDIAPHPLRHPQKFSCSSANVVEPIAPKVNVL